MTSVRSPSRRKLLAAGGAAALGGLAGCSALFPGDEEPNHDQVQLTIKTVPADDDALSAAIMSEFRENATDAGIAVSHEPVAASQLYRDLLVEGDFDVFVTRVPILDEPDVLRRLCHSDFRGESGWQNPFNITDVTLDDLLEAQYHAEEDDRERILAEVIDHLGTVAPYTVVGYPDHRNGRRRVLPSTRRRQPNRSKGFLELLSLEPTDGAWNDPLRVGLAGDGITDELNPVATAAGRINPFFGLVYDPIVRIVDEEAVPWLAEDVSWAEDGREATVSLEPNATWHDGTALSADDVVFTMKLLEDTSLGSLDSPVPAPRYRGRRTTIDAVTRLDASTVEFTFDTSVRPVAERALTIPILPEHVWEERAEPVGDHETAARTADNEEMIGSGLLKLTDRSTGESISFEVTDEHPMLSTEPDTRPAFIDGFASFEGIEFHVSPVQEALPELLLEETIDVTSMLSPAVAGAIDHEPGVALDTSPPDTMYILGYNLRHPQLGDPRFRSILSRLVDRDHVYDEHFNGDGLVPESIESLIGLPKASYTSGGRPSLAEFPGEDGEVDVDRVRRLFESVGYRYADDDLLDR